MSRSKRQEIKLFPLNALQARTFNFTFSVSFTQTLQGSICLFISQMTKHTFVRADCFCDHVLHVQVRVRLRFFYFHFFLLALKSLLFLFTDSYIAVRLKPVGCFGKYWKRTSANFTRAKSGSYKSLNIYLC